MLEDLCEKYNVDYDDALWCKYQHPEFSDEEIILYYRPELEVNILGEIIGD
jgi:hypothetical protein